MITLNKRDGYWQVQFRYVCPDTGKRKRFRRNAPHPTKREAHKWGMEQYELALTPKADQVEEEPAPLFANFAERYLESFAKTHLKASTRNSRVYRVRAHLIPAFGEMRLDEIGALDLDEYVAERREKVKAATVKKELNAMASMFREAKRWGLLEHRPEIRWPETEPPEWRFLEDDELERLVEACKREPLLENLVPFVANTGLRTSEFLALRWEHLDLKRKLMTVKAGYAYGETGSTKSGKARTVPLNETAMAALKAQRAVSFMSGDLVFPDRNGEQMNKQQLRKPWKRAIKAAGIRYVTRHDLRHTFASHLVQRGVSLQVVKELLGHAELSTTLRYAHLAPKNLEAAVAALDTFGNEMGTNKKSG